MLKTCVKKQGCYGSKDPETDHGNRLEIRVSFAFISFKQRIK